MCAIICHNTDLGHDGWERGEEDPDYFKMFSEEGGVGINIVTYNDVLVQFGSASKNDQPNVDETIRGTRGSSKSTRTGRLSSSAEEVTHQCSRQPLSGEAIASPATAWPRPCSSVFHLKLAPGLPASAAPKILEETHDGPPPLQFVKDPFANVIADISRTSSLGRAQAMQERRSPPRAYHPLEEPFFVPRRRRTQSR